MLLPFRALGILHSKVFGIESLLIFSVVYVVINVHLESFFPLFIFTSNLYRDSVDQVLCRVGVLKFALEW